MMSVLSAAVEPYRPASQRYVLLFMYCCLSCLSCWGNVLQKDALVKDLTEQLKGKQLVRLETFKVGGKRVVCSLVAPVATPSGGSHLPTVLNRLRWIFEASPSPRSCFKLLTPQVPAQ